MTVNPIEHLDVPLATLAADLKASMTRRELAGCLAEQAHLLDPADALFARLACEHGDRCSTTDTYPGWTPGGSR